MKASLFHAITGPAARLDAFLHKRLGRPYRILLTVGLITDIVHRILEAPKHVEHAHGWLAVALAVMLEVGLLIHQVGEIHERTSRRLAGEG